MPAQNRVLREYPTWWNNYLFDSKVIFIIFFFLNSVRLSGCIVLNYLKLMYSFFLKFLQIVTSVFSPFPKNACVGGFMYINRGHRKKKKLTYKRIIEKQDLPVIKSLIWGYLRSVISIVYSVISIVYLKNLDCLITLKLI